MTILVTGASGFLGGQLVRHLVDKGENPILITRSGSDLDDISETLSPANILTLADNTTGLVEAISEHEPDVIYHCAGKVLTDHNPGDVEQLIDANLKLFAALLDGCARTGKQTRFINVGTYLEHDNTGAAKPNSLYAATKLAALELAKFYVQTSSIRFATVKPSIIYGPTEKRKRLLKILTEALQTGEQLDLSPGDQFLDLVHVDDVVAALIAAATALTHLEQHSLHAWFATSGERLTLKDLVSKIETVMQKKLNINWGGVPYKKTEVMAPFVDGPSVPGWRPAIDLQSGLRQFISAI